MSANFALLQSFALGKLLSEPLLADLNIKSLRDLQAMQLGEGDDPQKIQDAYLVWTTPRAGGVKIGCGSIVNMPTREYRVPNVHGPERTCLLTLTTFEDPTLNVYGPNPTGKTAEEWSDLQEAILHQWMIESLGTIWVRKAQPTRDVQGVVAYNSEFVCEIARDEITEVTQPTITDAALTVTLACATAGATIAYTIDGSFPGVDASTGVPLGTALIYNAPFLVPNNTAVLCAAYKAALRGSTVTYGLVHT